MGRQTCTYTYFGWQIDMEITKKYLNNKKVETCEEWNYRCWDEWNDDGTVIKSDRTDICGDCDECQFYPCECGNHPIPGMPEGFTIYIHQENLYDQWCVQEIRDCDIYLILDKNLSNVSWKEKNKIFKETNFEEAGKLAKLLGSCEEEPNEYILTSTF